MEFSSHLKEGSEINIQTYDLYKDRKGNTPCHIVKLRGIDSDGSPFKIILFSHDEEQANININSEDNIKVLVTRPDEEL